MAGAAFFLAAAFRTRRCSSLGEVNGAEPPTGERSDWKTEGIDRAQGGF